MNEILDGGIAVPDYYGIYCPQVFAKRMPRERFPTISEESWSILEAGPEHESYWDTWAYDFEGQKDIDGGTIYQDGDIWIVYAWKEDDEE